MIPVSLGHTWINLLSSSDCQPVWVCNYCFRIMEKPTIGIFFTTHKVTISLKTLHFTISFNRISVSLGNTRINLLSSSEYQPVWVCNDFFWDSGKVNNINCFTTNKMPIYLTALDFPLCFHMVSISMGNTQINLLSSSDYQPVWVRHEGF